MTTFWALIVVAKSRSMKRTGFPKKVKGLAQKINTQPFIKMVLLLSVLWLVFSSGMYLAERGTEGTSIKTYGEALYWGVAAFSTAGIANTPISGTAQLIGGLWIVIGSMLFFGTIVATVTAYFMGPMQRPHAKIIDAIKCNLEQVHGLTLDDLNALKSTAERLIAHVERLKEE